jgi:hypothetical protein
LPGPPGVPATSARPFGTDTPRTAALLVVLPRAPVATAVNLLPLSAACGSASV